ncbi:hypothetical protein CLQ_07053 [Clostridium botulinum Af84]|nr:hypothetical protein CLQ_07053 [Clostridium botulinum Af84]
MPKVIIVEPDITPEENEKNLKQVIAVLQKIANKLAE